MEKLQRRLFSRLRILIVDDDAHLTEFLKEALEGEFSLIMIASGLLEAKALIDGPFIFHLVICDFKLGDGEGSELHTWLRRSRNSQIPFLMISGKVDAIKPMDSRFLFLAKPFSPGVLLKCLEEFGIHKRSTTELRNLL